jgi:hypothetical protein
MSEQERPGKVLREPGRGFGVGSFMDIWRTDRVAAVGQAFLMGDRDSHPGQYLLNLVKGQTLDPEEVREAIATWLSEALGEVPTQKEDVERVWLGMVDIYGYARWDTGLCDWIAENFSRQWEFVRSLAEAARKSKGSADSQRYGKRIERELHRAILMSALDAQRTDCLQEALRPIFRQYWFQTTFGPKMLLALYLQEDGAWHPEASRVVHRMGTSALRVLRSRETCGKKEFYTEGIIGMLEAFFLKKPSLTDIDSSEWEQIHKKTGNWLRSQGFDLVNEVPKELSYRTGK